MAYTPKDWVTGEVITESALDHIEQGIANAGLVVLDVTKDDSMYTLSKSYNQIVAMLNAGGIPALLNTAGDETCLYVLAFWFKDDKSITLMPLSEPSSESAPSAFFFSIPEDGTADDNMVFDETPG